VEDEWKILETLGTTVYSTVCLMPYALCTMHYALCTMHYALCTMHYVQWTMHYMHCALCTHALMHSCTYTPIISCTHTALTPPTPAPPTCSLAVGGKCLAAEAADTHGAAIECDPQHAGAHCNLGALLKHDGAEREYPQRASTIYCSCAALSVPARTTTSACS
jgi:hypothetical protein